jgi:hypothetical protein
MVRIGQAEFTARYIAASILIFISSLCTLVAFAGPYWSQSYPSTGNEFFKRLISMVKISFSCFFLFFLNYS